MITDAALEIPPEQFPLCEICGLPVQDFYVDVIPGHKVLIAFCHSDVEVVAIPNEIWADHDPYTLIIGPVFGPKNSTLSTTGE